MPKSAHLSVKSLKLDLRNYRVLPQENDDTAIQALVAHDPNKFWAVCKSLRDNGYMPTENIIVLKSGNLHVVREGNRRVAALKLLLGYAQLPDFELPTELSALSSAWKKAHRTVPCAVYSANEGALVDQIVALTHGKAQTAGRLKWNAVARARYSRDKLDGSEPALDLLEKYLAHGKTVNHDQRERWGGDYPLSVLDEAMKRLATRCGAASSRELADNYPDAIKFRRNLENVLREIGLKTLRFPVVRGKPEFGESLYGFPPAKATEADETKDGESGNAGRQRTKSAPRKTSKPKAYSITDSRSVARILRNFAPVGRDREKVVALLTEARKLKLADHPISFCFVLRSMFELSAKAYCRENRIRLTKRKGQDKDLVSLLRDAHDHLTAGETDKDCQKRLHGAMVDLGNPKGLLSITSMNQLVHNPHFSLHESHICTVFGNVFPLLEAMNS